VWAVEAVGNVLGGLAVLLGIAVLVVYLGLRKAIDRRKQLASYAAAQGWRYEREQPLLVDRFSGAPFGLGESRRAYNALFGTHHGRDLVAFDYEYESRTVDGKQTRTHVFSVLGMNMGVPMPPLRVDPEGTLDRLVGHVLGDDIDLESEEFNQAFTVSCPDRRFASDVLHPRMMEYLLQYRQLGWRFERDSMLVVAEGRRTPAQIEATIQVMDAITSLVPDFVWLRLKGQG
jgi:hypothetical protein